MAQSSDAALGAALALGDLGADSAEALLEAAREEGVHSQVISALEAICMRRVLTDSSALHAYAQRRGASRRWALLVPRVAGLVDILAWEQDGARAGALAVVPFVHMSERFAHAGWLANAEVAEVIDARDALAQWVLQARDHAAERAMLRPYAWLLDVEPDAAHERALARS